MIFIFLGIIMGSIFIFIDNFNNIHGWILDTKEDCDESLESLPSFDVNTLFFYELKKKKAGYIIEKKSIDISFAPDNVKNAVSEYIQERFNNWFWNVKNFGEQNKDIYAEAIAAKPKLAAIYDVLKTLFVDQGRYITEQTEQQFFTKLPLICELIDDANKKVFDLANWESVKSETEEKALTELNEKENNAKIQTAFSKLDAMTELNSNLVIISSNTKMKKRIYILLSISIIDTKRNIPNTQETKNGILDSL